MWSTVLMLLAGIFVFGVVVLVHEAAHFLVARAFGVGTPVFSIGFGPALWSRRAADGTLYRIGCLPLGGYIKLEGEMGPDAAQQRANPDIKLGARQSRSFYMKPIWQRMLVVLAGPFSNFVLAFLLFWCVHALPQQMIKPVVGYVTPDSIAAQAGLRIGDQIMAVDGYATADWPQVMLRVSAHMGDRVQPLVLRVRRLQPHVLRKLQLPHPTAYSAPREPLATRELHLDLHSWQLDHLNPQPLFALGFQPYHPAIPLQVKRVIANSTAQRAGVQVGDRLLALNHTRLHSWEQLRQLVAASTTEEMMLTLRRGTKQRTVVLQFAASTGASPQIIGASPQVTGVSPQVRGMSPQATKGTASGGATRGTVRQPLRLGVVGHMRPWPAEMLQRRQLGLLQQLTASINQVVQYTQLNLRLLWRLLQGELSMRSLGGPVMIFQVAGYAVSAGYLAFIEFIGVVSVLVGFFNLLPIPVVDGGVFILQIVEWLRGKAEPRWVRLLLNYMGLTCLGFLFLQSMINDWMRFF